MRSTQCAIKKAHATLAACAHSNCCYTCMLILFLFASSAFRTCFVFYVFTALAWWACGDLASSSQILFYGFGAGFSWFFCDFCFTCHPYSSLVYAHPPCCIAAHSECLWYPRPDSNRHAVWPRILSPLCLPIPSRGLIGLP